MSRLLQIAAFMKRALALLAVFATVQCFAQSGIVSKPFLPRPLDGVYHSKDGLTIHISDSLATISYSDGDGPITTTIAVCTITEDDANFIRIDSPSPYDRVMNCIRFEESFSADFHPDSVYVTFDFPVRNETYWIEICDGKNSLIPSRELQYPEQNKIVIPRALPSMNTYSWGIRTKGFSLTAELFKFYVALDIWCVFPVKYRNYKTNILRISVPCIDDDFFEQAWIQGEYIKVCDEGLIWRGSLYKREKEKKEEKGFKIRN